MKKMKVVNEIPSSSYTIDDGVKATARHASLLQDYLELQKETLTMKNRLEKTKKKKQILSTEVRFLRQRYEYLSNNPPQKTLSKHRIPKQKPEISILKSVPERDYREKFAFDLNQSSEVDGNGDLPMSWESLKVENTMKRNAVGVEESLRNDFKLPMYRENGVNRPLKLSM